MGGSQQTKKKSFVVVVVAVVVLSINSFYIKGQPLSQTTSGELDAFWPPQCGQRWQ